MGTIEERLEALIHAQKDVSWWFNELLALWGREEYIEAYENHAAYKRQLQDIRDAIAADWNEAMRLLEAAWEMFGDGEGQTWEWEEATAAFLARVKGEGEER